MRRVWTSRGVLLPLLLAIAVSFAFLGRGGHNAEASPFKPTLTTSLSSSAAGAASNINQFANWGTSALDGNRSFPAQSIYFTPGNWGIPNCAGFSLSNPGACPFGLDEQTGTFSSLTTAGLLNSQCFIPLVVSFPRGLRNSSTDPSDTIAPGTNFANLEADANPMDGIPDGEEHWNTLLNGLQGAGLLPATPPRERQTLSTVIALTGTHVWVDALTYDPGLLGGAASAPLGYATTFVLQNANPLNVPDPAGSLLSDVCGLNNNITESGLASPSGTVHRSNPSSPGTSAFFLNTGSARDADQGPSAPAEPTTYALPGGLSGNGFVNNLDTCPFQPNAGSPIAPAGSGPLTGDSSESPGDGIDEVCDPNPSAFDGSDADGDFYLNRGDNCPLVNNGLSTTNQSDVSEAFGPPAPNEVGQQPVDGGPANDGIGDACDFNATVPDGHFHQALKLNPVCVGLADSDGDGWCDLSEGGLGSNPGSAASTPEALAVPGSCSDGADNDGDGNADLNDGAGGPAAPTGCQQTLHDLSIKKLNGNVIVPCAGGTVAYTLLINNPGAADDAGEISIYLDSQPSYVPGPGPSPAPGKSAGSVASFVVTFGGAVTGSGPINDDGDADVEWLTKAAVGVKHSPATTAINFNVTYPPVSPCSGAGTTDFMLTVDLCHGNDVAPLGVGPLNGNCAGSATSDGGQDRNSANDIISKSIDAQ